MIRIIGGDFKGRKLRAPRNLPVRPTTDRAKEALFNILYTRINFEEVQALDLFCGTGNLSFELISRGCKEVTCVDNYRNCIAFVEKTCRELGIENINAIKSDALHFLNRTTSKFDLILADPPYDYQNYEGLISAILAEGVLSNSGSLIIEHDSQIKLQDLSYFKESRRYGNSSFSFFKDLDF